MFQTSAEPDTGTSYGTQVPSYANRGLLKTYFWSCLWALQVLMYSPPRSYSELFFSPKSCNFLSFLTKNTSSVIGRGLLLQVVGFFETGEMSGVLFSE